MLGAQHLAESKLTIERRIVGLTRAGRQVINSLSHSWWFCAHRVCATLLLQTWTLRLCAQLSKAGLVSAGKTGRQMWERGWILTLNRSVARRLDPRMVGDHSDAWMLMRWRCSPQEHPQNPSQLTIHCVLRAVGRASRAKQDRKAETCNMWSLGTRSMALNYCQCERLTISADSPPPVRTQPRRLHGLSSLYFQRCDYFSNEGRLFY